MGSKAARHEDGRKLAVIEDQYVGGHGGASGRYERYKEIALRDAFLLYLAGITD